MKLTVVIMFVLPIFGWSQASLNIDSIVIKYLRTQPNTSVPILTAIGNNEKRIINRNYFFNSNKPITKGSLRIITYLFGSSDSHAKVYFLITILKPSNKKYEIIKSKLLEEAIAELLSLVKEFELSDSQKAILISQMMSAFF